MVFSEQAFRNGSLARRLTLTHWNVRSTQARDPILDQVEFSKNTDSLPDASMKCLPREW